MNSREREFVCNHGGRHLAGIPYLPHRYRDGGLTAVPTRDTSILGVVDRPSFCRQGGTEV